MKLNNLMLEEIFITRNGHLGVIMMHPMYGSRTGYVGINDKHPLYEVDYDDERIENLEVHGGVTFAGKIKGLDYPFWFIGFDCMHFDDIPDWDSFEKLRKVYNLEVDERLIHMQKALTTGKIIWTKEMVKNEIENLSEQLKKFEIKE